MPEGVTSYPRWQGPLLRTPAFPAIAVEEIKRAWRNSWVMMVLLVLLMETAVFITSLVQQGSVSADRVLLAFNTFVALVPWFALILAALVAGPILQEDRRQGALELYLSRAVKPHDYLLGKALAVFAYATLAILGPGLLFVLGGTLLVENLPSQWGNIAAGFVIMSLVWGFVVTGLGLGLSAATRSARAATLILVGTFAFVDIASTGSVSRDAQGNLFEILPIEALTRDEAWRLITPLAAIAQQRGWMFGVEAPFEFPAWWGAVELVALAAVGWGLLAWKRPKVAGA